LKKLISACQLPKPPELEVITKAMQVLAGNRIVFTDLGKHLGFFPNLRHPTAKTTTSIHGHDFLELVFILSGSARHQLDDRSYRVKSGDLFFINSNVQHAFNLQEEEQLTVLNFAFLPDVLERALTLEKISGGLHFFLIEPFFRSLEEDDQKLHVEGDAFIRLASLAHLTAAAFFRHYPEKSEQAISLLRSFLLAVGEEYQAQISLHPRLYSNREKLFDKIVSFLDAGLLSDLSISQVSEAVGLGRTKLMEIFREKQGMTIVEYINKKRILVAGQLLTETDMPIIEVAHESGFNDLSHFNRMFKKITGNTPRSSRNKKITSPN
jgi:AraC-like DNA-binding protein/mannose-6-phosphate isomerase-like protein (cupin superfamily)